MTVRSLMSQCLSGKGRRSGIFPIFLQVSALAKITSPRCKYPQETSDKYIKTLIKEGASLGANSTIVCGTTVGRHAFVGAGAVVTRDIPDYALVYGNPAKIKGWICECGEKIRFENNNSKCAKCGLAYKKSEEKVEKI